MNQDAILGNLNRIVALELADLGDRSNIPIFPPAFLRPGMRQQLIHRIGDAAAFLCK